MDGSLHAKHVNSAEASNSSIVTDANWIALESPELTSKPNLFPVRPSSEPVDTNVASKEQVQNFIQTVCNTPPEQLSSGCEADVTVSTVLSAHTQMSLDSKTGQIPLLSQPESFNFSTTEDQFKATVSSKTATQSSTPVQSSMKSAQLSGCTSFTTVHISQTEYRSSPDSGSEYVADLEMPIHECRPTSPESAVSLPIDSPISFDYHYRSDSLDSCALMAEIRASSPESVASGTDQVLLSPDSPLPDFRPLSPLPPVCEHETPVFTVYVEECRTSGGTGNEQYSSMHVSDTQFIPRTSYLMVFDETNRPISPGSMIEFRSVTPESNESLSSVSFHSESLDRETSPEKGSEYDHWSNADILIDMPSSPEATGSLNEYISLSLDSPVPSFTPEVFDFLGHVKEYLSSSSQSEISDVDPELSLEWLFEGRQSSPESVVSVNEWMVLSPDSPLPSFVQNVCQLAMPTKECRSVSPETDFSDREYDFVPPVVSPLESRPSSPESLASVHEHRPLSPDSPIPHCTSAVCELHTSVGGYISNSPESDLSDRDYRPISPIAVLSEDRPSSPELVSSVNVHRPFSSYSPVPAYRQTMSDYDISLIQKPPSLEMGLSDIVCSSFDPKVPQSALKTQSLESKISETDNSNEIISGSMLSHDSVTDSMILSSRQILKASEKSTENLPKQRSELDVNKQKTDVGYTVKPFISELTNQASCAMNITVVPCTRSSHQEVQDINITAVKQEFGENKVHLPKLSESVVPEHQALFAQPLTSTPIEQSLDSSPTAKYKLVFKHVLNNLMRNIYDPQYKGETFCPKPGVFEYSPSSPNVASSSAIAQGPLYSLPCPKELDSTLTEQYSPVSEPLTKAYKQYSLLVEHCFNSEAIKSEFESHPLSLEPVNEYKPMTPESLIFLEHLRTSSPESTASVDELRALSPDSPVPQYVCMYFEPDMSITGDRSLTPESAITEEEYDMTADQLTVTYCRPSSPQSIASGDRRPLSPDSPIPEFRTSFPESSLPISGYRSCSPDSLCSESIEYENVLGDLFTAEKRPESPDSFVSEVEDRPFSPDSISEYRPRSPESMTLLSDTRGFSPDSVSECRPSSPDSPTPQFSTLLFELVPVIGHRSSSLESLASDTDYDLNVLTDAPSSYRLSSPDSMTMADEFSLLSTDSPIPEFRSSFPETVLPVSGYRSCSSESVSSESTEYDGVLEDFVTAEQRPESPDSFVLDVEDRPLSPDSIPEYRPISPESMSSPSDTRGSSPDSVSEYRPLSPDSPIPHYSTLMLYEVVPVIRHRSSSLESLASDTDYDLGVFTDMAFCHRSSSPDSIASANESRPLSPDSPVPEFRISFTESSLPVSGYRPCSPESVCSESTKYECFLGDLFTVDQRPESPDSVSECRPLSPDSPIPQYSALLHEVAPFIGHRWSSLESLASDTDYKLNVVTDAASYQRPSSPDSMASVGESRPLSPDSPVPEFRSSFPDNAIPVSGYRSCSPDSVCSEPTEYESCFEECITLEERPESQDSFVSEVEDRPLSPDSIPEYRPMSPGSINFLSDIRGSSPDFVSRSSSLSPDSPIPQYSALLCELVPVIGHRSSSLESLASDTDYDLGDLGDFTDEAFCQRPSSPDSMASANKNRPLSPDSPVPEFRTAFPECSLPVSGYRPCSPESVCSESTKYECFLGDLFTVDQRPESPDSVSECRPLSPDSPIPQYSALLHEVAPFIGHRWSSLESLASDTDYELNVVTDAASYQRPSSPDSMASVGESRPLSPDSPVPEFRSSFPDNAIPVSGYRSCSPDSVCSEPTEYESCFEECFTLEERPESPDSFVSEVEDRPLSPDSIPEYRPMSPGSMNFLSDIRGSSPDFVSRSSSLSPDSPIPQYSALLCELVPVIGHRSSSLESLASDTDYDLGDLGDFTDEAFCQRPSSPDSMASANKNRPLSPDSPVPEFRTAFPECSLPVSGYRPCSPESVCSESTKYECFLGDLFTVDQRPESPDSVSECRPLSPDSPIPQYSALLHEVAPFIGHRWSSLESLASDTDYELNVVTDAASYQRPSSPDSMASVGESRPLSPDSPVPEFRSSFPDNAIPVSGYRSCSPDSVCSEPTEYESCFEECFTLEERPESPDSFVSEVEDRPLSPDSIPEYRPMSPGSINFLSDIRGSSPDFVSRSSSLSPDSPIPQYSALLCELVPVIGHRSSSLESLASDTDYDLGDLGDFTDEAFCHRSSSPDSMASANESRPLSPDSPVPNFRTAFPECSLPVSGYRPCSPESVCSESTEYECFLRDLFTVDQRPESPDSVSECRPLSPDSPIPQYSALLHEVAPFIGHRWSSLESLASDTDYELNVVTDAASYQRPSSPDSMASVGESRPLSPDSPVPEFRSSFPDNAIPVSGYRSCSPDSVCSEPTEYESCFEECFTLEERPESPDSFVSEVEDRPLSPDSIPEYRPMSPGSMNFLSDIRGSSPDFVSRSSSLSPDSPIPQYSALLCELVPVIGHRSSSLESLASDTDYDLGDFTDEASCHRSSSPDSMASANESRPLSPDSPVPEFRRAFPESSLPVSGYRPCSPEFVCSESTEYECFLGDLFTVDQRPESPDSVSKHRQMSPDSPILQYSTLFCELVPVIQHRSSSLESLASDTDYDLGVFTDEAFCHRSSSPDSMASANENRPLSPDSPVPEFRTAFPERSLPVTGYRSCSPMSVCSESTEYECFLGDLFTVEQRPVSPDSVGSLNQSRSLSPDSPIPEFRSSFPENTLTFSGYESCRLRPAISEKKCDLDIFGTSSPDATQSVNEHQPPSLDSPISMFERMKQDAVASLEDRQLSQSQTVITNVTPVPVKDIDLSKSENQTASETMTSHLFQEAVKMVPEYKLVYKAIPFNLRSNIYDPQYKGETYSPKTGVFEYTGCRMEVVQTCKMDKPHGIIDQDDYKVPSAALGTSQITKCSHKSLTISHEYNNQTSDERIKEKSDSLILDSDIRPESPESVTSETWGKDFVEKTSPALIVFLDKVVKQGNTPHGARDVALLHTEQCGSQTETISEPDYTNSEPPAGFQRPFSEDLNSESKPLATCHEFVLEPEQGTKNTEADSANMEVKRTSVDEVCKVLISTQEDSHGMRMAKQELEFQDKQDLEDKSDYATQLACQQTKARALQELSEKDISFRAQHIEGLTLNQGDSYSTTLLRDATDNEDSSSTVQDSSNVAILEQRLKLTASPSTSDAIESPASDPKTLPSIQERNTSLSSDLESVHHKPFKQSLEQAKTTSELYQIHTAPFQFYMQESHRTVTPNLSSSTSPILRFDYAPPDYTDVLSKSPGSVVSPTDMSPLSPVFNESFSDQAQSTDLPLSTGNEPARTIGSFQLSPGFQQVLSEFENTLAALHKTSTRTALAPSSKEVTHELEVSEQSTEPMDDIRLMGFDLKAKPLSVHADSLESDPEFFECLQTFSDISEPEIRSGELLDVPGAIYQVEEPSSLPSTPDFDCLTGTLKRKECTHEEKEDRQRPISWDSEELDLPIVLEPEDEYVGEHGEAYPYGYADEHSFAEELPPREEAQFDDDDSLGRDIAEELGLLSDSSEEEVLTTRVVRRRVIIQGDDIPEIPPQTVTEEQYTDEYGNIVVKKITRKIIRKYVSADGVEREEVMVEGGQQEAITVDEADSFSKVVKRTVVRSGGDQTEVTFSEPLPVGGAAASEFEVEPVHGRKVSKVIKTMVVQGERMEKQIGDPLLSADLPSAKDDFEKALSYVGGFEKVNLPHLVEKEMVKEDGSVVRRTCMRKTRTQKKTVAKDGQSKHTHLEQLEDTPEALRPDALQQHLHQLLQRYCTPEVTEEPELVAVAEDEGKREEKQDTNDKFSTA
ncbi:ankyrin-2b isoform X3 [Pygocentrus nattereri]|uniref:ankyrin-2b isoform X3 n=1 Tax=Pygocentrus nattereri TaxID=42514 RepID=UPI001890CF93|nr:ankyrin-2b isoform X3 [Pygocentrus nattereri]